MNVLFNHPMSNNTSAFMDSVPTLPNCIVISLALCSDTYS